MEAIKNLFSGAHAIKTWLLQCAKLIALSNNPVSWITPMGLPVIQPYRVKSSLDIVTTLTQNILIHKNS